MRACYVSAFMCYVLFISEHYRKEKFIMIEVFFTCSQIFIIIKKPETLSQTFIMEKLYSLSRIYKIFRTLFHISATFKCDKINT